MGRICNDCGHFVKDADGKCLCPSKGETEQCMENKHEMENKDEQQYESEPFDEVYNRIEKGDDNDLRIVLIGKTGSGKSATGNTLLGYKAFNAKASGKSVTQKCEKHEATRNDKKVVIVDTPGLFDTTFDSKIITLEIQRCINLTFPGPHLFLFVFGIGRFTLEENEAFEQFITIFGDDFIHHAVLVFTRLDDLEHDGMSIETYLEESCPDLKNALDRCNGRYITVNNRLAKDDLERCSLSILEKLTLFTNNNAKTFFQSPMHTYYKECIEEERIVAEKEQQTGMDRVQSIYEKNLQYLQHAHVATENDRSNHDFNDEEEWETSSDFDVDYDPNVNKTESKVPNEVKKGSCYRSKNNPFQELSVAADNDLDHRESREREKDELFMKRQGAIEKLREGYENRIKMALEKVLEDERLILENKRKRLEAKQMLRFGLSKEIEKSEAQINNDELILKFKYKTHFDKMQHECDRVKGGLNESKEICRVM